jgi:hypothetical protein
MTWSVGARRALLLLGPLALPAWIGVVLLAILVAAGADLGRLVLHLWKAPRKRDQRYGAYGYGR